MELKPIFLISLAKGDADFFVYEDMLYFLLDLDIIVLIFVSK